MRPYRSDARLIGALFLAGFLFYGLGFGLVASVIGAPDFMTALPAHQTALAVGAFLMLLNTVVDVGKGVLFFPILETRGKRTALAYLSFLIVQVVLLDIGVLCLLMLAPAGALGLDASAASSVGSLLTQANTMAYQIAEMTLGLGTVLLCALLFRTHLIPRSLAAWGLIGYAILMTGAIAEILGVHIGLILSIPGGLFEVALGVWLLTRGFAAGTDESRWSVGVPSTARPTPAAV